MVFMMTVWGLNDAIWIGILNTNHVILNACEESALKLWSAKNIDLKFKTLEQILRFAQDDGVGDLG